MKAALYRALGFSVPTLALVTVLHVVKDASVGEAVDGLVSGLWFAALFLFGVLLRIPTGLTAGAINQIAAVHEVLVGLAAAVLTWCLLWLIWEVPRVGWGFFMNSAVVFVIALSLPAPSTRRRRAF